MIVNCQSAECRIVISGWPLMFIRLPTAFAFSLGLIQCKDALEAVNFSAGFGGSDHRFGILESI